MIFQKTRNKQHTYGIIGLGRFGSALAMELVNMGKEILVIDWDEEKVKEFRNYTENAYVIKSITKKTLEDTGISNCDVVAVCIAEKMENSILATLYLSSLGVPKLIAKAKTSEHGQILEKLGAEVVYPEKDMAVILARKLENSRIVSFFELSEKLDISQLKLPDKCIGKSIRELDIRKQFGLNIIAVQHIGEFQLEVTPEYVLSKDDTVVVIGSRENIMNFENFG